MREILFRGKTDKGEWVQGAYYHQAEFYGEQCSFHYIIESCDELEDNMMWALRVIPETIGQYTGLIDKNGTKIFEGDIVKTDKFSEPNKQYIIKYDLQFGAFIGQDKYNAYFVTFDGDSDQFEIIGNIHDCKAEDFLK